MLRRRPLLRAAAVGGAAYYAGQRANARGQAEADQDERLAQLEAQQAYAGQPGHAAAYPSAPTSTPGPTSGAGALTAQLQDLATLRDQGVLTDAEFAAAKAKLLDPGGGADPR